MVCFGASPNFTYDSARANFAVTGNTTITANLGIGIAPGAQRLLIKRPVGSTTLGEVFSGDGVHWYQFNSNSSAGAFNSLVQANDHYLIFSDGSVGTGNLT